MRNIYVAPLDRMVSVLGFGCASLGSRISAAVGRRAVDEAFNSGVTLYDVAPPYGDGYAEQWLGQFLAGRRDKVVICTKVGIARPSDSLPKRLLRPVARSAVTRVPRLRNFVSRARAVNMRGPIDPASIEPSVKTSLRHLKTDYIDVLAIHEPSPQEATDGLIFDELSRLVTKGLVRTISIAGAPLSIIAAGEAARPIDFAQFADDPTTDNIRGLRTHFAADALPVFVTHGVFSSKAIGTFEKLAQRKRLQIESATLQYGFDPDLAAADLSMIFALGNNPYGVVLASMFSGRHIQRNCALASRELSPMLVDELCRILRDE